MVAFTWCGRPSEYQSSTSIRLCTGDHDDSDSDVGQRLQDHLRRRVDDDLSRCSHGH